MDSSSGRHPPPGLGAYKGAVRQFVLEYRGQPELEGPYLITRLQQLDNTLSFPTARELNQAWAALRAEASNLHENHPVNVALNRKERRRKDRKPRARGGSQDQDTQGREEAVSVVEQCLNLLFTCQDWLTRDIDSSDDPVQACEGLERGMRELQGLREGEEATLKLAREQTRAAQLWLDDVRAGRVQADDATVKSVVSLMSVRESQMVEVEERLGSLEAKLRTKGEELASLRRERDRRAIVIQEVLPALRLLVDKVPQCRPPVSKNGRP